MTAHDAFEALLSRYNAEPKNRTRIVREIEAGFERPTSILVLDTCGFSRSVRTVGIIPFLALLQRLTAMVRPIVADYSGTMLHSEADNLFVTFSDPAAAVGCAVAILDDLERVNAGLPVDERVEVSFGIGFGTLLVIDGKTVYGDEMNLAAKLGEDVAREQEVLLTQAAYDALDASQWQFELVELSVSGMQLTAYRLA